MRELDSGALTACLFAEGEKAWHAPGGVNRRGLAAPRARTFAVGKVSFSVRRYSGAAVIDTPCFVNDLLRALLWVVVASRLRSRGVVDNVSITPPLPAAA